MRIAAILSLLLFAYVPPVLAADPELPELLKNLGKQGVALRYLGGDNGMDGWVGFKDGQEQYFYVTPDRQAIVSGILLNNKGDRVTLRQIEKLRAKDPSVDSLAEPQSTPIPEASADTKTDTATASTPAGSSKAQELFNQVEAASWITLGQKTAPVIYSFIDPQCPHCHDMIQDFRKSGFFEKGLVQLRLVPVGLMDATSLLEASNLLEAANPAASLYKHLDGDKTALQTDKEPNTQAIQRNMILMQTWKLDVTPFSIYKNKDGTIKILRGRPDDLKGLVADLK